MLYLLFELGQDCYALDSKSVVAVLPLVEIKRIPPAMKGIAGLINYRGAPIPLLDVTELNLGRSSNMHMSTRIIVINYPDGAGGQRHIGLLAERVTDAIRRLESDFRDAGVDVNEARFLGPVTTDGSRIIQRVEIQHLLPDRIRDQLFSEVAG